MIMSNAKTESQTVAGKILAKTKVESMSIPKKEVVSLNFNDKTYEVVVNKETTGEKGSSVGPTYGILLTSDSDYIYIPNSISYHQYQDQEGDNLWYQEGILSGKGSKSGEKTPKPSVAYADSLIINFLKKGKAGTDYKVYDSSTKRANILREHSDARAIKSGSLSNKSESSTQVGKLLAKLESSSLKRLSGPVLNSMTMNDFLVWLKLVPSTKSVAKMTKGLKELNINPSDYVLFNIKLLANDIFTLMDYVTSNSSNVVDHSYNEETGFNSIKEKMSFDDAVKKYGDDLVYGFNHMLTSMETRDGGIKAFIYQLGQDTSQSYYLGFEKSSFDSIKNS